MDIKIVCKRFFAWNITLRLKLKNFLENFVE